MKNNNAQEISFEVIKNLFANSIDTSPNNWLTTLENSTNLLAYVENYIRNILNRSSYFVTYRPSPQHIDEAYVQPLILDTVLAQTYIQPDVYKIISNAITEAIESIRIETSDLGEQSKAVSSIATHLAISLSDIAPNIKLSYLTAQQLADSLQGILILGEAGTGKSSLLSYLCTSRLSNKEPLLPVLLDTRELSKSSITAHISEILENLNLATWQLSHLDGKVALYVDGIDELEPYRYKEICVELRRIKQELPNTQITVTCRAAAYNGELSFLKEVTIIPFDKYRSEEFIHKWFINTTNGPSPELLIEQLNQSNRLAELSTQPLLLSLMCNAYRRYLNISKRQSALFDQCITSLLWQWDADRAIKRVSKFSGLYLEKKKWLHCSIAVKIHDANQRYVSRRFITNT